MNKRQEIVLWIAGLLIAGICAYHGLEEGNWLFAYVVPLVIVSGLLLYRFRSSTPTKPGINLVVIGTVLVTQLLLVHETRATTSALDGVASQLEELESSVESWIADTESTINSRIDDLERTVKLMEFR